jgi:hypothetical protein
MLPGVALNDGLYIGAKMAISVLKEIAKLNKNGKRAMTTTPLKVTVLEEIEVGNLMAAPVKTGPLGLTTGEVFLDLTDAGRAKLSDV